MITTTIQISDEVQRKLFQLINKMEKELGRRISYNEAIQYLLDKQKSKVDKKHFIKNLEKFRGTLKPGEGKEYLKEMRALENERDKRIDRH
ncbi:MAG TPA: hypothetical protein VMV49_10605 [Candidatus Deferrimicrobium sp.]|nr:hypothetical protein [Candidatus Deferrimicrobium sp.]